jgi:hypothetical protein
MTLGVDTLGHGWLIARTGKAMNMAESISAEELPSTLDHLVEAWHDRAHTRQAFDHYRRTVKEPPPPPSFGDVSELIAYNQQKERYQEGLANAQVEMETSRMYYVEIAHKVERFLPPYSPLRYAYQGERDEFKDKRFVILNTGTEVTVEPYISGAAYF